MRKLSSCACSSRRGIKSRELIALIAFVVAMSLSAWAQSTINTGSIVGTVTDPSGAVVSSAKVTITNKATGQIVETTSNATGAFSAGLLKPGNFTLRVEATGFKTTELPVVVLVDTTSTASVKLQLGQTSEVVEVTGSEVAVNTEQATVQGVLTATQIENLPVNGRNFLDLAQLEPGVGEKLCRLLHEPPLGGHGEDERAHALPPTTASNRSVWIAPPTAGTSRGAPTARRSPS